VNWREPEIFGQGRPLTSFSIQQPELRLSEWIEVSPQAGSDFILPHDEQAAYHPPEFVPKRDMPMAEKFGVIRISRNRVFQYHMEPPVRMGAAVSLLGQCSGNYAHFVTEVLPRLTVVDKFSEYRKLPLLVDGWMPHESHFSLIRMFGKYKREIIRVGMTQCADVHRLITISPTAYASPESRSWVERQELSPLGSTDYRFNISALNNLRELALRRSPGRYGRRLFLWRKPPSYGNARNVLELGKLARAARRAGFDVIDPANMKIEEQIKAFRGARIVVGPSGAALANLVFTPPGCEVVCLAASFEGAEYYYFSNLMQALGHSIRFVVGPQEETASGSPMHRSYSIDLGQFNECIASLLNV
jgi:capsular polysaccharide biosynthesis protein